MRHTLMLTFAALMLAGCATGYQQNTQSFTTGGYSDEKLGPNLFNVTYDGIAGKDEAIDFFYLRASEVTLQNGFKYFVLVTPETRSYAGRGNYLYAKSPQVQERTYNLSARRKATSMIECHKEKPNIPYGEVFDAEAIGKTLQARYKTGK